MSDPLLRNLRDPGSGTDATLLRVCWQAADEIERLQRRVAELEKALRQIAGLDFENAATNGAAYDAVQIATGELK